MVNFTKRDDQENPPPRPPHPLENRREGKFRFLTYTQGVLEGQ